MQDMKQKQYHSASPYVIAGILLVFFIFPAAAQAQEEIYLSFEALNYAPLEYALHARTLPIPDTEMVLAADVFSRKQAGVLTRLDPEQYTFHWFLAGVRFEEGRGKNEIRYRVPRYDAPATLRFRAELVPVGSRNPVASETLEIPVVKPFVVLHEVRNKKPSLTAKTFFAGARGTAVELLARPYFFNVVRQTELAFRWRAQGQSIEGVVEHPELFTIQLPQGPASTQFSVSVERPQNPIEQATISFSVTAQ